MKNIIYQDRTLYCNEDRHMLERRPNAVPFLHVETLDKDRNDSAVFLMFFIFHITVIKCTSFGPRFQCIAHKIKSLYSPSVHILKNPTLY